MTTTTRSAFGAGALLVPFLLLLPAVASAQDYHSPDGAAYYAAEGTFAGPGGAATFDLESLSTDAGDAAHTASVTYAGLGGAGTYEVGSAVSGDHDHDFGQRPADTTVLRPMRAPAKAAPETRPVRQVPDSQQAKKPEAAEPAVESKPVEPAARPVKKKAAPPVEADEPVKVPMEAAVRPSPSYAAYHHSGTHAGWGGAGSHEVAALAGEHGALFHASGTKAGFGGAGSFSVTSGSTR